MLISGIGAETNIAGSSQCMGQAKKSLFPFICRLFRCKSNPYYSLLGRVAKYGGALAIAGIIIGLGIKLFTYKKDHNPSPSRRRDTPPHTPPHTRPQSPTPLPPISPRARTLPLGGAGAAGAGAIQSHITWSPPSFKSATHDYTRENYDVNTWNWQARRMTSTRVQIEPYTWFGKICEPIPTSSGDPQIISAAPQDGPAIVSAPTSNFSSIEASARELFPGIYLCATKEIQEIYFVTSAYEQKDKVCQFSHYATEVSLASSNYESIKLAVITLMQKLIKRETAVFVLTNEQSHDALIIVAIIRAIIAEERLDFSKKVICHFAGINDNSVVTPLWAQNSIRDLKRDTQVVEKKTDYCRTLCSSRNTSSMRKVSSRARVSDRLKS